MNLIEILKTATRKHDFYTIQRVLLEATYRKQFEIPCLYLKALYEAVGLHVQIDYLENISAVKILKNKNSTELLHVVLVSRLTEPMDVEDIKDIFLHSNLLIEKYGPVDFKLLSISGYSNLSEDEHDAFNDLGLSLYNFKHIMFLLRYRFITEGESTLLTLFNHNEKAYRKTIDMLFKHNRVAVVQATGTGKSKILLSVIQRQFYKKNILLVAPGIDILDQFKLSTRALNLTNITYLTYKALYEMDVEKVKALKCDLILLDEIHRLGAKTFSAGFEKLTKHHPDTKIIGVTATPVRTLDGNRDVTKEFFFGNVSNTFHLEEAINSGVLPSPKYISAVYDIKDELDGLKEIVKNKHLSDAEKYFHLRELENIEINWDGSKEITNIFKKHIDSNIRKILVFCENETHLEASIPMVSKWFVDAGFEINVTSITSEKDNPTSRREKLSRFRESKNSDIIELLFSINILNEGVHIPDVNGAIFLRRTVSEILYLQQLGRVLEANKKDIPVVFDFVCNFNNIKHNSLYYKLKMASDNHDKSKELLGLDKTQSFKGEKRIAIIESYDESEHLGKIFENLRQSISTNWTTQFNKLKLYYKTTKKPNIFKDWDYDIELYIWSVNQIKAYNEGCLSIEKIKLLDELGFDWDYYSYSTWHKNFFELSRKMSDIKIRGYAKVLNCENAYLNRWCTMQRSSLKKGTLKVCKIALLNSIGFDWNTKESKWVDTYIEFRKLFIQNRDLNLVKRKSSRIRRWLTAQNNKMIENSLEIEKIALLDSVTVSWRDSRLPENSICEDDIYDEIIELNKQWILNYINLYKYLIKEGNINIPSKYIQDKSFGYWVKRQRELYNNNQLHINKADLLSLIIKQ